MIVVQIILAQLVKGYADHRICLVSHEINQGVGGFILTGYRSAVDLGAEIIVKMDGDIQMDPDYLIPLTAPILMDQADYTKGNRFLHTNELKSMLVMRHIRNAGLSFLTKIASGYWNIFGPTNGYTAIHASIIHLLGDSKIHRRYFFESSMLIELGMQRAVICDVLHISARYQDETSSLSEWKTMFEFPPLMFAGFLHRVFLWYFIRDFGVVSMLFLFGTFFSIFGIIFGVYHWYVSPQLVAPAPTGIVMLVVLPIIMEFQLAIQTLIVDIQNIPTKSLHKEIAKLKILFRNFDL
jgi:dolichol-phosphate mannosyltransferase